MPIPLCGSCRLVPHASALELTEMTDSSTHYYPVGRAIGYFFFGLVLLGFTTLMFAFSFFGFFIIFSFVLAILAVVLGVRAITTRKNYPMHMGPDLLTFFRKGVQVQIRVPDLKRVWFNTSGIDKRVSLALADGSVIDIPVLYGLDELRKKLQKRYGLTAK